MSTANRPTWTPASGTSSGDGSVTHGGYLTGGSTSMQFSVRDMPSHMTLKMRDVIPEIKAPGDSKPKEVEKEKKVDILAIPEPKVDDNFGDFDDSDESDSDEASNSSDSEDDDALLLAEFARVKKEKELAKQKEEQQKAEMDAAMRKEEMLHSNPLMFNSEDGSLKRRWDDDVVFRNQGKADKKQKRFINDTIRSDFHIEFMNNLFR